MSSESRKAAVKSPSRELPDWRELIGHGSSMAAWRALAADDRLPQVMMLVGRSGLGKRGLLAMHAALSLCDRRYEGSPGSSPSLGACGTCVECRAVLAGVHPEVHWVEPEDGKILIEASAELQEFLALEPESRGGRAGTRLVLIADSDRMTPQGANRLLKILEEPPPRARIVMTTSRPRAVLETVRSRCVAWRITPPPAAETTLWLQNKLKRLSNGALQPSPERLAECLKRAGLAPGEALSLALLTGSYEADGEGSEAALHAALTADLAAAVGASTRGFGGGQGRDAALPATFGRLEDALDACLRVTRATKIGIEALLAEYEVAVNAAYRRGEHPPAAYLARRREVLSRARSLASFGRVALNAQLAAEAATLAGMGAS